ncbi:leucyl aminopeptidase [Chloroflexota bacterium]
MELKVIVADVTEIEVDALILNLFEGVSQPGGATAAVDKALDGAISQLIASGEIKGKLGENNLIHTLGKIPANRVLVAGLGKQQELNVDRVRRVTSEACRFLRKKGVKRVATITHGAGVGGIEPEKAAQAIAEGSILGLYTFRRHVTKEPEPTEIEELIILEREEKKLHQLEKGCATGKLMAEATNFARDMINEPANFMTPSDMAKMAEKVAAEYDLGYTVLEREKMQELGMGALLGVAQGSQQPPKFIVLKYEGGDPSHQPLGLVGKGITFDSGGISIKPSERMSDMKGDMAGGATAIAALRGIAELKPKINVTALIPATENLPSGTALKPGDVLKAMNGKTIEIANTDAEGRLILADALSYARKLELTPLVDVATLTGACQIALGDLATGAFTNNQELLNKVIEAGAEAGERLWQMPMFEEYKEQNKSEVADIKNTGGRYGGAITAAQFLSEFAEDTPWVHLDIAGTSFGDKEKGYLTKGASGVGVRTLINLAIALAKE